MFNFRIIDTEDGNQVIRKDLKTPYDALTLSQYIEYINMETQLYIADRQKRSFWKKQIGGVKLQGILLLGLLAFVGWCK